MIPWYGLLVLFPLFCAFVGWVTNVFAVHMIFYPVRPKNILGLRFQGVLPKHREHFAREMAEVVTSDFMTTGEMVQRLDADAVYAAVRPQLLAATDAILEDLRSLVPEQKQVLISDSVVAAARKQMEREVRRRLPEILGRVHGKADGLVNLTDLVTDKLLSIAAGKFVELVAKLGQRELQFIKLYGALFGLVIGLVQFTVSTVFSFRLTLIVVGMLVGAVTNFFAIQMLFFPRQPRRVLFFKIQGLFPKRQEEIAAEVARVAARDFIVTREVFSMLATRALPDEPDGVLVEKAEAALSQRFGALGALLDSLLSSEARQRFRDKVARRYREFHAPVIEAAIGEADRQLDIHAILRNKVVSLSKLRFEAFTRALFSQEEIYLVAYGALTGGLLGGLQLTLLVVKNWI